MKNFPMYNEWINTVVHPSERNRPEMTSRWEYFYTKYSICSLIKPRKICELGVRFGYSAYSFCLTGPEIYHGYDKPGLEGGAFINGNPHSYCETILANLVENIRITNINTKDLKSEMMDKYDFIHVDAGHTYEDAARDLDISLAVSLPGAYILVDDYSTNTKVAMATENFIKKNKDKIENSMYFMSLKGERLIKLHD
jgi:hypothetical protein